MCINQYVSLLKNNKNQIDSVEERKENEKKNLTTKIRMMSRHNLLFLQILSHAFLIVFQSFFFNFFVQNTI